MSRLPGNTNNESTSELVNQSFIEHLTNARGVETDSAAPRAKRHKLSCAPGKSLSADDIPAPVSSSVSSSRKATKVTRPTPGISAESERDEETRSNTTGTTSAASSGRSDDSDVEPDTEKSSAGKFQLTEGIYVTVQYEGCEYPGEVIQVKNCGAKISCMERSGRSWKWPARPDELFYHVSDTNRVINPPKKMSKRGLFIVPEMTD